MIPFENIKTIFFDYDGTLHNSINLYAPAFRKAYAFLVKEGYAGNREWSEEEIGRWLGYNPKEMWENFRPDLSMEIREHCSNIISQDMMQQIEEGKPVLFEGALETLQFLKEKGYHLVFISNCKIYYRDSHTKFFNLDKYFESLVCSDEYNFIPKHEILRSIKENYPEKMLIVGDRKQDIDAGKKNGIYTIGCKYGYALNGELDESDLIIENINDLRKYF